MRFSSLAVVLLLPAACAQIASTNPFVTHAEFSADSEASPSTRKPELLHPRLSLSSAVPTITRLKAEPRDLEITIVFYSFPFTERDVKAARRGDTAFLDKRWHATQSTTLKSPEFNGGGRAIVELTLNERFQIRGVNLSIPDYGVELHDRDLKAFVVQDYKFDGKKLRLKSHGSYRPDLSSAGVPSFTMSWSFDLSSMVVAKATAKD